MGKTNNLSKTKNFFQNTNKMTFHLISSDYPYEHEYYVHPTLHRPQYPHGRRRQMQLLEEQKRKRVLEERMIAKEMTRRRQMEYEYELRKRMEEELRRRKIKQMILEQQRKEKEQSTKRRVIVQGPDGNYYAMSIVDEEQKRMDEELRRRKIKQMIWEQQRKEKEQSNKRRFIVQGPDGNYYAMFTENSENVEEKANSSSSKFQSQHTPRGNNEVQSSQRRKVPIQENKKEGKVESRNGGMKLGDVVHIKRHNQSKSDLPGSIEIEDASDDESENSSDYSHLVPEEGESWMEPIVN